MVSLNPGQTVNFVVTPISGFDPSGNPILSNAVISGLNFLSSDPAVFTVVPDPANPLGGIITALTPPVIPDSAVLTAAANATEVNGDVNAISATDTVTVQGGTPPPPPAATSFLFTYGTPTP